VPGSNQNNRPTRAVAAIAPSFAAPIRWRYGLASLDPSSLSDEKRLIGTSEMSLTRPQSAPHTECVTVKTRVGDELSTGTNNPRAFRWANYCIRPAMTVRPWKQPVTLNLIMPRLLLMVLAANLMWMLGSGPNNQI